MTVFFVVGTRPNLVKLSPFIKVQRTHALFDICLVHTGQHTDFEMSEIFFKELDIPLPDFFIEADNKNHAHQTASIMLGLDSLFEKQKPKAVVVFGDVNSTLAACLVATKRHIPCFHVEAGLRSFNTKMPEEINRIVADSICDVLYAPTEIALNNLKNEGLAHKSLFVGDVMFDAVLIHQEKAEKTSQILERFNLIKGQYYLATLHRPYNVDNKEALAQIVKALGKLDRDVVFVVHPRTLKNLKSFCIKLPPNIKRTKSLGYFDFLKLQKHALKIITDSGGVQKEAFFLKKNCITLRPETEWVETLANNANLLVKTRNTQEILKAVASEQPTQFSNHAFGNGHTAEIISKHIAETLKIKFTT